MLEKLRLEQWRKLKNLSQEELAIKAGISTRSIVSYENDIHKLRGASYNTISKIANALGIRTGQIFLDNTSEKPI